MAQSITTAANPSIFPQAREQANVSTYLFFRTRAAAAHCELPEGYTWRFWWPSEGAKSPDGVSGMRMRARFAFRWALDRLRLFASRECGALCVYFQGHLVHYSGFTPRYWRFPFLAKDDLQIGHTWTDPAHRGKGIARFALAEITTLLQYPNRDFWYVVGAANAASIRVAESVGFTLAGDGRWRRPLGIKLLGSYRMTTRSESAALSYRPKIPA